MPKDIFQMIDIYKSFGGVKALRGVDLRIGESEIIGLLGENGAGKSTLMKVLTGVHQPDAGEILFRGNPIRIHNTQTAHELGISTIFQEFNLCPNLSALENLYLGNENTRCGLFVDYRRQKEMPQASPGSTWTSTRKLPWGVLGSPSSNWSRCAKSLTFNTLSPRHGRAYGLTVRAGDRESVSPS